MIRCGERNPGGGHDRGRREVPDTQGWQATVLYGVWISLRRAGVRLSRESTVQADVGAYAWIPFLPNVRLIAPDRPGYGQTDYRHGITTVECWPEDVVALADWLEIDRVAVFGPSGGGLYALACGWRIPERLTAVGVFAGVGPSNTQTCAGLHPTVKRLWELAQRAAGLIKVQLRLMAAVARRMPRLYAQLLGTEMSAADRELYRRLNLAEVNIPGRNEGTCRADSGAGMTSPSPARGQFPWRKFGPRCSSGKGKRTCRFPPQWRAILPKRFPIARPRSSRVPVTSGSMSTCLRCLPGSLVATCPMSRLKTG